MEPLQLGLHACTGVLRARVALLSAHSAWARSLSQKHREALRAQAEAAGAGLRPHVCHLCVWGEALGWPARVV